MDGEEKKITSAKLKGLILSILSTERRTIKLVNYIGKIVNHSDILFYTWKTLMKILSTNKNSNEIFMLNVLDLLEKIKIPKNVTETQTLGLQDGNKKFIFHLPALKKIVTKVWEYLINRDITLLVHKKLIFLLVESYLSKLNNPVFLTDFMMASMNIKGLISILALEGMSQLIQKHNIEYPDIYGKLYALFEPDIFYKKYKSRLFYLADLFLSSIYLPESIVASFAKRVSVLSLNCTAPDILIILRFVENLLIRHPSLKTMIHHSNDFEVSEDPFLRDEPNPMKTLATKSSLWEISLLRNHCLPAVSSAAKFIEHNLPSVEFDLGELLSKNYEDIFESECKKKMNEPSLTYERPQFGITKLRDDQLYKMWLLSET